MAITKHDLVIITSFMGYPENRVDFNLKISGNILATLNDMGFGTVAIRDVYPGAVFERPTVKITFDQEKNTPKGMCVQHCLKYAKEFYDPKYTIYIDGSNKIDPKYIIDVGNALLNSGFDAVLSERTSSDKAISKERWDVEKFELFLLEEKYNQPEFIDGQAGLWGFKILDGDKKIEITSNDYCVEWNLLSQLLRKHYKFGFVPIVATNPAKKTVYDFIPDSISKMEFICKEESIKNYVLIASLDEFCIKRIKLVQDYIDEIKRKFPI